MSQINPFTGSILQSTVVQRAQATERDRQIRHTQQQAKGTLPRETDADHPVENTSEIVPAHEDQQNPNRRKNDQESKDQDDAGDEKPHIDLTA